MACAIAMILAVHFSMLTLFRLRIIVSRKICKVSGISVSAESKKFESGGYSFLEYNFERISSRIILAASSTTLVRSCSILLHLFSYHAAYKMLSPVPLKDKIGERFGKHCYY